MSRVKSRSFLPCLPMAFECVFVCERRVQAGMTERRSLSVRGVTTGPHYPNTSHLFHYIFFMLALCVSAQPTGRPRYGFVTSVCILLSFGSLPVLMLQCSARRTSQLLLPDLKGRPPACLMPHCSARHTSQFKCVCSSVTWLPTWKCDAKVP